MCSNGQPCANWEDPQEMLRRKGESVPLTKGLSRLEEKFGSHAAQEAYDDLFWEIIQGQYVKTAR
jgi:hypothetical protein